MFIRCANCHAGLWVDLTTASGDTLTVHCRQCRQEYQIEHVRDVEKRELYERARRFAQENEIDLPAAYSVLMGIMTLAAACDLSQLPAPPRPMPVVVQGPTIEFDPDFADAVAGGFLTPRQALERGRREAYAARMAERHNLSPDIALAVADNRVSLLSAIRKREARKQVRVDLASAAQARFRNIAVGAVIGLLLVGGIAVEGFSRGDGEASASSVEVRRNDEGRIMQILGPDPETVLENFCRFDSEGADVLPLGLMPSTLPNSRVRVGVFRKTSQPDTLLAIAIRRDRNDTHWIAGDGRLPLEPLLAPKGAAEAFDD